MLVLCLYLAHVSYAAETSGSDRQVDNNTSSQIEVQVVSKEYYTSNSSCDREVEYEYNDTGQLISSMTKDLNGDGHSYRGTYEYDYANRVSKVTYDLETYLWQAGSAEEYTYDADGRCLIYYEPIYEGDGSTCIFYDYDSDGNIVKAAHILVGSTTSLYSFMDWSYSEYGHFEELVDSVSGTTKLIVDSEACTIYEIDSDRYLVLLYDEDGLLMYKFLFRSDPDYYYLEETRYEYKTITVDPDEYVPSIYSNPTGFDFKWKPQLTEDEIANIMSN